MQDISNILTQVMNENKCTSVCAFLILSEENNHVPILQSKPTWKIDGRLRDKRADKNTISRLG